MPAELATSLTATDADRLLQAESVVRDFCGWHIAPLREDATFAADAPRYRRRLFLPTLHLVAVTAISVDGDDDLFDVANLDFDVSGWVAPKAGYYWPESWDCPRRLELTFDHGYAEVPPSVSAVVQALALRGSNSTNIRQVGDIVLNTTGAIPSEAERAALEPYRLLVLV